MIITDKLSTKVYITKRLLAYMSTNVHVSLRHNNYVLIYITFGGRKIKGQLNITAAEMADMLLNGSNNKMTIIISKIRSEMSIACVPIFLYNVCMYIYIYIYCMMGVQTNHRFLENLLHGKHFQKSPAECHIYLRLNPLFESPRTG